MSEKNTSLSSHITATPEGMRIWQQERAIVEVTERICELMEEQGITRAELAKRLGKSRGYITQILGGSTNLTLRSLSDIYLALDRQFHPDDGPITIKNDCGSLVSTARDAPNEPLVSYPKQTVLD